jgi:hypothetical protein
VARPNINRSTDSGLKSASGASSANHDRVFGKRRFRTDASGPRGALVAELATAIGVAHWRHDAELVLFDLITTDLVRMSRQC